MCDAASAERGIGEVILGEDEKEGTSRENKWEDLHSRGGDASHKNDNRLFDNIFLYGTMTRVIDLFKIV